MFADYGYNYNRNNFIFEINNEIGNKDYIFSSENRADRFGGFELSNGRAGIDYYLSSKTIIGALGTMFVRNWAQHTDYRSHYHIDPGVDTLVTGIRIDKNPRKQYMANINLQHNFDKRQKLNIDFDYFKYSSNQFQTYSNEYTTESSNPIATEDIRIDKITPLNMWVGKLDYKYSGSNNFTIESGVKATISQMENDVTMERYEHNTWIYDPVFSEFSTMDENILAAYSSFSTNLGEKLGIKAGIRYEHTHSDLRDIDDKEVVSREYGNFFPSAFITRKLTANSSLNLAYSSRIRRPSFSNLAPYVLFIEPKTFSTGNTNLLPARTNSLRASYTFKKVNVAVEYNRIKDAFVSGQASRIQGTNSTILSIVNLDQTDMFNLNLSLPIYVTEWWEMNNNLSGITSHITSDYYNEPMDVSHTWYTINSTQSFTLPKNISIELNGKYFSGRLSGMAKIEPYGMISFGIRKKLRNDGGILNLNFSDVFGTFIMKSSLDAPQFNLKSGRKYDFDPRAIKLTYTKSFGNKKVKSRNKRKTGSNEDLKRVGN